ncbi:MAG: MMPL family transporter [Pseudomonadales bacterium]
MNYFDLLTRLREAYFTLLKFPKYVLWVVALMCLVAGYHARDFSFDASADDLVVQGDPKLEFYRQMSAKFTGDDFLVVTYASPDGGLFSDKIFDKAMAEIAEVQSELEQVEGVHSVFSILDAPLLQSPPIPLERLADNFLTLEDPETDIILAEKELTTSPLFSNYLISTDGKTTALLINLVPETELESLRVRRDELRAMPDANEDELERAEEAHSNAREAYLDRRDKLLEDIRRIRDRYKDDAIMYLGGVPMVAADMITFVKHDIAVFGSTVVVLIMAMLFLFFRRLRWVLLPMLISGLTLLFTIALLGFFDKPVTVISANFVSLLGIICISFSIHLIVRYRELLEHNIDGSYPARVRQVMVDKFIPCLYTALTTMVAFSSMMASGILPVDDFGWMMCLGIAISFVVTYVVFPAVLLVMEKGEPSVTLKDRIALTELLSRVSRNYPGRMIMAGVVVAGIALGGLSQLSFNNRFIDYFGEETEIRQGMEYIDKHLGGTVPFDVYIKFSPWEATADDDPFATEDDTFPERYWYTPRKLEDVRALHDFTASHFATGKVISLATLDRIARQFNEGEELTALEMSAALGMMPDSVREQLIEPYADPPSGYARINARVKESGAYFSRDELIADIKAFADENLDREVRVTGMMVLFNDMLKQLYDSQLSTLVYVVVAILIMFTLLLRSILLAILALIPNIIAAATVIAFMGYAGIPMDMMTITIAAISVGIGVHDAIHYLHRFQQEYRKGNSVTDAVRYAHETIGHAMYFTSLVVIGGFSVLALSNFLPTVYFGVLTALAMLLAMLANLILLPSLLIACLSGTFRKPR